MKLYNTLTKRVEDFIPWDGKNVKMYTCGPTVYYYAHIGNLRTYIMEDILEKTLRYLGYNVTRCMNITDVGHLSSDADTGVDKMVRSAQIQHKSVLEIAKFYTDAFFEDFKRLNIKKPDIVSPATENIAEYVKIIQKLLDTGYAYANGGNIYFDTSKLNSYFTLTNGKEEDLISGVRDTVEEDSNKKNKNDFVLWFTKSKFDSQELKWDTPFGTGYPGWHIECSGISLKNLGEYLDIHCGGVDNIFPHHTNEIAQSESYIGHPWCKYWVHGEHLNTKEGKMSKSKGESLTINTLVEKGYNPLAYRYMVLTSHYQNQLVFSYEGLENAENAYQKLLNKIRTLKHNDEYNKDDFNKWNDQFKEIIGNNLDTANSLTLIYDLLKSDIDDSTKYHLIKNFDEVLSLDLVKEEVKQIENEDYILEMIQKRNEAKQNKDYALADQIRNELLNQGIILKDTREGTIYEVK